MGIERGARIGVVGIALAWLAGPALAVDGVIEINQARAEAGGVTPGDAAGFPVTLSLSGSYVLTSDLSTGDGDVSAINTRSGVRRLTIDLNGFSIVGGDPCTGSGSGLSCPNNAGRGISATASRVTVKDGTIQGFGTGIAVGAFSRVENVTVTDNAGLGGSRAWGIDCAGHCVIQDSIVSRNEHGIELGQVGPAPLDGGLVAGSTVSENQVDGIVALGPASVVDNLVSRNGRIGIFAGARSTIGRNNVSENEGNGIEAGAGSTISGNAVSENGGIGIKTTGTGCLLNGNTLNRNNGSALQAQLSPFCGYTNTVFYFDCGPETNTAVTGGEAMSPNVCRGVVDNPLFCDCPPD